MLLVDNLRCEYAVNPLGIGTAVPRLSWQLHGEGRERRQTAYQVIAAATAESLENSAVLLWDSGAVESAGSVAVEYGGPPLASRERAYWRVRCWDEGGYADGQADGLAADRAGPWSEVAWFEAALLDPADWLGGWIGYAGGWPGRALYFRKEFAVEQPVVRARLYASGLGYGEYYVNGARLGDALLDPAYTDVAARVMYRTYDVGPLLRPGANVFAATVGNGWHGAPKLLAQLEVSYADGAVAVYASQDGDGWQVTCGPVLEHSIYGGETYDARQEKPGWNLPRGAAPEAAQPSRGPGSWTSAQTVTGPAGKLTSQMIEPIGVTHVFPARAITCPSPGVYVVDFGQNIAGWAQIRVQGARGMRITLRFAEMLYDDGTVNQENLREIPPEDVYILKGGAEEIWEPRFTYHGFRYVQVEGYPGELTRDAVTGKVVRSTLEEAGTFECSSDLLNRIHAMIQWTERDNHHGIPTDCPQRNERMGWLNDMSARAEEAFFNFNMARFMAKWIGDIYDSQDPVSGGVPLTAPRGWMAGRVPTEPVSVSYLETSWLLYAHYGDRRTMAACYDGYQGWLRRIGDQALPGRRIVPVAWVADWAPPLADLLPRMMLSAAPAAVMGTGYYYYGARLLARMAAILGRTDDCERYAQLAAEIAADFDAEFWDEAGSGYAANNQSCNSFALWLGIVPDERRARVVERLLGNVAEKDYHLATGNVCTKYLLEVLSANGLADVATAIASQTTYPSWGYMLAHGATTLWERWEEFTSYGMNSHNHPMMGSVGSWFYKFLAGINITPETAGFDRFVLQPRFVKGLEWVRASHRTVRGVVESGWRRKDNWVIYTATVPVNAAAAVILPLSDGGRVSEGGRALWPANDTAHPVPGIASVSARDGEITLRIGSGLYEFALE
jgi:alpha-L-rhamnosidase